MPVDTQLQRLLDVLAPHGFVPRRVSLAPDGSITLYTEADDAPGDNDLLAEWEFKRARQVN